MLKLISLAPVLLALSITGCTASSLATAKSVSSDLSSAASLAPAACAILASSGVKVGTACSSAATDASDVAKLVSDLIASLPQPQGAKGMAVLGALLPSAPAPVAIKVKAKSGASVDVTLPPDLALQVQKGLQQ